MPKKKLHKITRCNTLGHTKTKSEIHSHKICMWVRKRCSIYQQNRRKKNQKIKLYSEFLKETNDRVTKTSKLRRKGHRSGGGEMVRVWVWRKWVWRNEKHDFSVWKEIEVEERESKRSMRNWLRIEAVEWSLGSSSVLCWFFCLSFFLLVFKVSLFSVSFGLVLFLLTSFNYC